MAGEGPASEKHQRKLTALDEKVLTSGTNTIG